MTDNHDAGVSRDGNTSKTGSAYGHAKDRVADRYHGAKESASHAYDSSREKMGEAYEATRKNLSDVKRKAGEGLEHNPLAALGAGIAIGALLGALLPRTRKEVELLGDVSRNLSSRAREAVSAATSAAREAGTAKLDELGLSKESAKEKAQSLVGAAKEVAASATQAAGDAARGTARDEGGTSDRGMGKDDMSAPPQTGTGGTAVLGASEDEGSNFGSSGGFDSNNR